MERYTILGPGSAPSPPDREGVVEPAPWQSREEPHVAGDDGGESLALWARRDLEATLQLLADRAQYITGGSGAAIALRDGEHIVCRASSGPSAPEVGSYLEVSSGLSGESVRTRKILRCDDASCDPRVNYESCRRLGIRSFLVMPLLRNDEVIGIFEIFSGTPHSFQERDVLALERMGEMVNTALDQVKKTRPVLGEVAVESAQVERQELGPSSQPMPAQVGSQPELAAEAASLEPPGSSESAGEADVSSPMEYLSRPQSDPDRREEASSAQAAKPMLEPDSGKPSVSMIRRCSACGFPVSEGRVLCLDCEKSAPQNSSAGPTTDAVDTPPFLADLVSQESQPSGIKHWIVAHKYLIGIILVMGSTIAFLLLR